MRGVHVLRGRRRSLPMTDTHDSYLQSDARQEAISAQKELFLRGLPVDTTVVSDFVLRSWQRSRLAGVLIVISPKRIKIKKLVVLLFNSIHSPSFITIY